MYGEISNVDEIDSWKSNQCHIPGMSIIKILSTVKHSQNFAHKVKMMGVNFKLIMHFIIENLIFQWKQPKVIGEITLNTGKRYQLWKYIFRIV